MTGQQDHGFSLLEALIAASLLAGAIGSLVYLVMQSAAQSANAQRTAIALVLAQSKLEELRAADFRFDPSGARIDSAVLSPASGTLLADSAPYVEMLDRHGSPVTGDVAPAFRRRWSIERSADLDSLTLGVCVVSAGMRASNGADACVWTLRVRRP